MANAAAVTNRGAAPSRVPERTIDRMPNPDATAMTIVRAISTVEKVPLKIRAIPRTNSQMLIITPSQKVQRGAAADGARRDRRATRISAIVDGIAWTM